MSVNQFWCLDNFIFSIEKLGFSHSMFHLMASDCILVDLSRSGGSSLVFLKIGVICCWLSVSLFRLRSLFNLCRVSIWTSRLGTGYVPIPIHGGLNRSDPRSTNFYKTSLIRSKCSLLRPRTRNRTWTELGSGPSKPQHVWFKVHQIL